MSSRDDVTIPLEPGKGYHIFNRGNESRRIFFQERNYPYFLNKYADYMGDYWRTQAYCLLPNHFHLAVTLKSRDEILEAGGRDFGKVSKKFLRESELGSRLQSVTSGAYTGFCDRSLMLDNCSEAELEALLDQLAAWTVSERFRRFLLGYVKAINIQQKRHGSLFQKVFRRKLITGGFSRTLVAYIHRNPVHHRICQTIDQYRWSSYHSLLDADPVSWLDRQTTLKRFGGQEAFMAYHAADLENLTADLENLEDFPDLARKQNQ